MNIQKSFPKKFNNYFPSQVCLPARGTSQATGKKCTVTGYGYMGESEFFTIMIIKILILR